MPPTRSATSWPATSFCGPGSSQARTRGRRSGPQLGAPRVDAGAGAVTRQVRRRPDGRGLGLVRSSPGRPSAHPAVRVLPSAIGNVLALLGVPYSHPGKAREHRPVRCRDSRLALLRARPPRQVVWLVPLNGVWACSHSMSFVSRSVGAADVVDLALDRKACHPVRRLGGVALSCVAAAVTPAVPCSSRPWPSRTTRASSVNGIRHGWPRR